MEEGLRLIAQTRPELIFLDIKMPGKDGFALLEGIRHLPIMVVFVTAYDEYAVRAFRAGAIDYLLKPVDIAELKETETRVNQYLPALKSETENGSYFTGLTESLQNAGRQQLPESIRVYMNNCWYQLQLSQVISLEALGAYTRITLTDNKEYTTSRNIGYYEDLLDEKHFFRVHKSFIVNMDHVVKVDRSSRSVTMKNNLSITVAHRTMSEFCSRMKTVN